MLLCLLIIINNEVDTRMLRVLFLFKDAHLILIPLFVVATLTVNTGARVEGYIFADSKKIKKIHLNAKIIKLMNTCQIGLMRYLRVGMGGWIRWIAEFPSWRLGKKADLYFLFLKTEIFVFHESLQKARYFAKIPALLAPLSEKLTKPLYTQDVLFSTSKCFFQNAASGFS